MKATLALALTALIATSTVAQEAPAPTQTEADLARAKADIAKAEAALAEAKAAQAKAEAALADAKDPKAEPGVLEQRPMLANPAALGGFCGQAQVEVWMMNTTIGQELRRKQQAELERMMQHPDVVRRGTAPDLDKVAAATKNPPPAPPKVQTPEKRQD